MGWITYNDETIMPFGKHKGKHLSDVPASYLLWLYEQNKYKPMTSLQEYIHKNLDVLEKEVEEKNQSK